ncbi:60S acidic ribosomal protein P0 [Wickerhamiella sorbophila]|uniref:60S acidic ribosomal protein P0 n=1 Tax=Wickerhamiella sorbophila TaxID=45607 RepID=A0A2T0FFH1_9ASCO|nr:60S acidic ribosomal protein P0 [Wickerhamiella sorbophila]PRT53717.1 60S acidic ribosomal protein P0 [Wickerhamiella sorbophila]
MGGVSEKKIDYFNKLKQLLTENKSLFLVGVDNVSSQQLHEVRKNLRGRATVLMGKNTMVRRAFRTFINDIPELERLLPYIKGNIGFVFTSDDLKDIREEILSNRVAAPARAGAVAPMDVFVPAGNTGMEPGKTSFFQALGIPTKITRGTIEITSDVKVASTGDKVGPSEATLLNMLNISPFTYGLTVDAVYNEGQVFGAEILDITDEELTSQFVAAVRNIATVSLASSIPTLPAVSHWLINNYKNLLAVSIATDYTFEGSEAIKDRIANPEAYAAAAPAAAASASSGAAESAAPVEEEEESDGDMGMGLFD